MATKPVAVFVDWLDAAELGDGGWMTTREAVCDNRANTIGWLVRKTESYVDVAHSYSGDGNDRQWLGGVRIPRSMIIELRGMSVTTGEEA